jgi:hypothetical protein
LAPICHGFKELKMPFPSTQGLGYLLTYFKS